MADDKFQQGWLILLAQPYAREYVLDAAREATQYQLYRSKFQHVDGHVWLKAVDTWVSQETRWPCVADLMALVRAYRPKVAAKADQPKLSDAPHIPLSVSDIQLYAVEHHLSFFEAIRQWETIYRDKMAGRRRDGGNAGSESGGGTCDA